MIYNIDIASQLQLIFINYHRIKKINIVRFLRDNSFFNLTANISRYNQCNRNRANELNHCYKTMMIYNDDHVIQTSLKIEVVSTKSGTFYARSIIGY